jgi:cytochrome c-type biogenesis protein CcmH/NrfF
VKPLFLALLLAGVAVTQTPQIESADVDRVGAHIACQCGGCKESVSCPMAKRGCGFCVPAKQRIYRMQKAGLTDAAIIETYKKEFGDKIYLADPSSFYWIVPAFATGLGLLAIYWFIRRMISSRAVARATGAPADPALARYQEEIDREMSKLE